MGCRPSPSTHPCLFPPTHTHPVDEEVLRLFGDDDDEEHEVDPWARMEADDDEESDDYLLDFGEGDDEAGTSARDTLICFLFPRQSSLTPPHYTHLFADDDFLLNQLKNSLLGGDDGACVCVWRGRGTGGFPTTWGQWPAWLGLCECN